ncbi:FadR/GntR family transcriptional regulator [Uliginosibacterium paludis]|uniref:FCD domain-containing protein n=1 Tax=Uliginosibacterium paludis TaxID=1615952 RepID=A0ABV2CM44_9RHOO
MARTGAAPATGKGGKLSRQVYASLLACLESGQFSPEGRLPAESELARQYQVSRPTIRKVLEQLREERRIVSRRGSGSYATRKAVQRAEGATQQDDAGSCLCFRMAVEPACVALAAEHHTDENIAELAGTINRLETAWSNRDLDAFIEADLAFHLTISRMSGNGYLSDAMHAIRQPLESMIRACAEKRVADHGSWHPQVLREHLEIFSAIRQRSSMFAIEAMNQHLGYARRKLCGTG